MHYSAGVTRHAHAFTIKYEFKLNYSIHNLWTVVNQTLVTHALTIEMQLLEAIHLF